MNSMTVGELKQKLSEFPDNYFVSIEHIEYDSIGEHEIATDVEITGIVKMDGMALVAIQTNVNLVEEGAAKEEFKK